MRIDKWLWCARFFKTRSQAADAVRNGKVLVGNVRTKPGKMIHAGERVRIRRTPFIHDIEILSLPMTRKPASEAIKTYRETEASLQDRLKLAEQIKTGTIKFPVTRGRPTKRDRRALLRFKAR